MCDVHLALASRDDSVTGNELGHHSTGCLNTERKGADIDENDVTQALITREDTSLDGSTVGNSFIRVDTLRGLLAKVLLKELLDSGNTG